MYRGSRCIVREEKSNSPKNLVLLGKHYANNIHERKCLIDDIRKYWGSLHIITPANLNIIMDCYRTLNISTFLTVKTVESRTIFHEYVINLIFSLYLSFRFAAEDEQNHQPTREWTSIKNCWLSSHTLNLEAMRFWIVFKLLNIVILVVNMVTAERRLMPTDQFDNNGCFANVYDYDNCQGTLQNF